MGAFIVLAVLPVLALANVGSFVKISAHGHSHEYNHGELATHTGHHVPHPAPAHPHPAPAPYHPAPAPYHPAPVHHAPAYGHPHHGYGYPEPKDNCTVVDVTETAEVCTPAFETVCADVEILTKIIVDKNNVIPSPVLFVLNPLKSSLKKSVLTNINKRLKIPL